MITEIEIAVTDTDLTPRRAHTTDAGRDLCTATDCLIAPGERLTVSTGVRIALPASFYAQVQDRSGLAARSGITTLGGVIDAGYTGEVRVVLFNAGTEPVAFLRGDRIAQLVVHRLPDVTLTVTDGIGMDTDRGTAGFGSTGVA
ncbi:dUTP diphosphatase [Corynebacterium variabile]|uniref:dUTP diphosphatase n=1 Tax=Corynebacterium variabile TaxID=1727 RepID=UPI003FD3B732